MKTRSKYFLLGVGIGLLLAAFIITAPRFNFEECRGSDVPRHCVD